MGRRNLEEETNVMKMKMVPTTEKQEAIRSVVSRAESWESVRDMVTMKMMGVFVAESRREREQEKRSGVRS